MVLLMERWWRRRLPGCTAAVADVRVVAAATIWHAPAGQATIACTLELREKGQILRGEVRLWRRWRSQLLLLPWRLQP